MSVLFTLFKIYLLTTWVATGIIGVVLRFMGYDNPWRIAVEEGSNIGAWVTVMVLLALWCYGG
jgi:hypothetical protein